MMSSSIIQPIKFFNSLESYGLPSHNLKLKIGSVIIMLWNINQPCLCNDTRGLWWKLTNNVIEARILKGKYKGEDIWLPHTSIIPIDMPFNLKRSQFPVRLAFAMTINKWQGQSLSVCSVLTLKLHTSHMVNCMSSISVLEIHHLCLFTRQTTKQKMLCIIKRCNLPRNGKFTANQSKQS